VSLFTDTFRALDRLQPVELTGTVAQVQGLTLRVSDLSLPIGAMVKVRGRRSIVWGEVVGFDADQTIVMLLGDTLGIRRGDQVVGTHVSPVAQVSNDLLGRVLDGLGRPIDGKGPIRETVCRPLRPQPVDPMSRVPIDTPLGTGVRAIDTMLTVGRGQRLGIFAGPGVGKSTVLGMMARQSDAQISVIALIGERGREVKDFIEKSLGPKGLERSVVVVATGDEPALMRIRAALYATSIAEFFRDQGVDVVLMMDSVTRFCQAQRQVGLAAGEPPATKGYTPSVFAMLPQLLERSGRTERGSITGFYTILVEGDDMTEPVSDAARGILDGHVVLDRDLANRGHWPAIDVLGSISRVATDLQDRQHKHARAELLKLVSAYRQVEDLVNIGAYAAGSNPEFDLAIAMKPAIDALLRQTPEEAVSFAEAQGKLLQTALQIGQENMKLQRGRKAG
jgi:flagellum-specific ATP synthase